mmetsp:Transcript_48067/g.120988  ORF Transcript_48067/g.120988 Transcript_48067/m.120988 type:complete len:211 (-) Transcript_48067:447-1079(-)
MEQRVTGTLQHVCLVHVVLHAVDDRTDSAVDHDLLSVLLVSGRVEERVAAAALDGGVLGKVGHGAHDALDRPRSPDALHVALNCEVLERARAVLLHGGRPHVAQHSLHNHFHAALLADLFLHLLVSRQGEHGGACALHDIRVGEVLPHAHQHDPHATQLRHPHLQRVSNCEVAHHVVRAAQQRAVVLVQRHDLEEQLDTACVAKGLLAVV